MNNAPRPSQRSTAAVIVQSLLWLWLIGLSVFVALNHQAMNGLQVDLLVGGQRDQDPLA